MYSWIGRFPKQSTDVVQSLSTSQQSFLQKWKSWCHFTPRMTRTKKRKERKIASIGEVVEKLEYSFIASGNVKLFSSCEKYFDYSSKKLNRITIWSNSCTSRNICCCVQTRMFIADYSQRLKCGNNPYAHWNE